MAQVQDRAPLRALIVEDNSIDVELMVAALKRTGMPLSFDAVDSPLLFEQRLGEAEYDIIISDYNLQTWTAIDALEILQRVGKQTPLVMVTGSLGDEAAVECIKKGAADVVLKDRPARLSFAILRALQEKVERGERNRLEEQLRQSQKMEAVGRLAGGIAHDFNNLLTIINGYSQLLLDRLGPSDLARGQVEEIKKAGDRAATLTRQLLAFSRRQVLQPQVLNLSTIVASIDTMLRRLIGEDIDLVTVLGQALGRVKADPGQIEQVILNLAVNARDAMPYGGKLTIETNNVELDEAYTRSHAAVAPGRYVMLAVSDTGMGMDAVTQAQIFEPFFTTKEKGKGTGLGLATVYGIVKQSGGHIWIYSEPGKGATFKVYLPRVEEAIGTVAASQAPLNTLRGSETILLVEDEEAVRTLAARILQGLGYKVLESTSPEDALQIGEGHKEPIDLLLTDVVMPGMSGRNVAEHLAFLRPKMKVLYMSGYTDNAIVQHGVLEAGTAFLQKPFSPATLAQKVRQVLGE